MLNSFFADRSLRVSLLASVSELTNMFPRAVTLGTGLFHLFRLQSINE